MSFESAEAFDFEAIDLDGLRARAAHVAARLRSAGSALDESGVLPSEDIVDELIALRREVERVSALVEADASVTTLDELEHLHVLARQARELRRAVQDVTRLVAGDDAPDEVAAVRHCAHETLAALDAGQPLEAARVDALQFMHALATGSSPDSLSADEKTTGGLALMKLGITPFALLMPPTVNELRIADEPPPPGSDGDGAAPPWPPSAPDAVQDVDRGPAEPEPESQDVPQADDASSLAEAESQAIAQANEASSLAEAEAAEAPGSMAPVELGGADARDRHEALTRDVRRALEARRLSTAFWLVNARDAAGGSKDGWANALAAILLAPHVQPDDEQFSTELDRHLAAMLAAGTSSVATSLVACAAALRALPGAPFGEALRVLQTVGPRLDGSLAEAAGFLGQRAARGTMLDARLTGDPPDADVAGARHDVEEEAREFAPLAAAASAEIDGWIASGDEETALAAAILRDEGWDPVCRLILEQAIPQAPWPAPSPAGALAADLPLAGDLVVGDDLRPVTLDPEPLAAALDVVWEDDLPTAVDRRLGRLELHLADIGIRQLVAASVDVSALESRLIDLAHRGRELVDRRVDAITAEVGAAWRDQVIHENDLHRYTAELDLLDRRSLNVAGRLADLNRIEGEIRRFREAREHATQPADLAGAGARHSGRRKHRPRRPHLRPPRP